MSSLPLRMCENELEMLFATDLGMQCDVKDFLCLVL